VRPPRRRDYCHSTIQRLQLLDPNGGLLWIGRISVCGPISRRSRPRRSGIAQPSDRLLKAAAGNGVPRPAQTTAGRPRQNRPASIRPGRFPDRRGRPTAKAASQRSATHAALRTPFESGSRLELFLAKIERGGACPSRTSVTWPPLGACGRGGRRRGHGHRPPVRRTRGLGAATRFVKTA